MICVTGIDVTVGSEVSKQLESANALFRAAFFSKEKAEAAQARGIDAIAIDYNRAETLRAEAVIKTMLPSEFSST